MFRPPKIGGGNNSLVRIPYHTGGPRTPFSPIGANAIWDQHCRFLSPMRDGLIDMKFQDPHTPYIDEMGKTHENLEAATFLNDFYVNVGPSLAKKHDQKWVKENCKINVTASFNFSWVTEFEVKRLVREICITKSSAIDNINTKLLKDAFEVLTFELTYLYNCCLQTGTFPNSWGLSKVTPIPKTNTNSTKAADWRPISQIPLPGKLLEKIIHAQLSSYIEMNNILSKNQYGFRKDLSTSIAIFDVLKVLFEKLE